MWNIATIAFYAALFLALILIIIVVSEIAHMRNVSRQRDDRITTKPLRKVVASRASKGGIRRNDAGGAVFYDGYYPIDTDSRPSAPPPMYSHPISGGSHLHDGSHSNSNHDSSGSHSSDSGSSGGGDGGSGGGGD